jgi:hypothetical protein
MKIVFTKKIKCEDVFICSKNIQDKIETITGKLSLKNSSFGHLSISHEENAHKIWLFLYDKNSNHEAESHGKDIEKEDKRVKKYQGNKITQKQIEKLL